MTYRQSRLIILIGLLLSVLIVTGCSKSQQDKYNDATSQLANAKKARQKAKKNVASAKDKVQQAKEKLDKAEDKLQKKRQKVAAANKAVNKTVSDEELFRTLQRNLVNKDKFSNAAISVGVNNRVVTLTGTVPDQETRKDAVHAARSQAGVASVNDQLKVSQGHKGAPKPSDNGSNDNSGQNSSGQ